MLQKLGRVLREKAATDLDRILNGASKTREKLGVRHAGIHHCAAQKPNRLSNDADRSIGLVGCRSLTSYSLTGHLKTARTHWNS